MLILQGGETVRRRYPAKIRKMGKGIFYVTSRRLCFESERHGLSFDLGYGMVYRWGRDKNGVHVEWHEYPEGFERTYEGDGLFEFFDHPAHAVKVELARKKLDGGPAYPFEAAAAIYYAYMGFHRDGCNGYPKWGGWTFWGKYFDRNGNKKDHFQDAWRIPWKYVREDKGRDAQGFPKDWREVKRRVFEEAYLEMCADPGKPLGEIVNKRGKPDPSYPDRSYYNETSYPDGTHYLIDPQTGRPYPALGGSLLEQDVYCYIRWEGLHSATESVRRKAGGPWLEERMARVEKDLKVCENPIRTKHEIRHLEEIGNRKALTSRHGRVPRKLTFVPGNGDGSELLTRIYEDMLVRCDTWPHPEFNMGPHTMYEFVDNCKRVYPYYLRLVELLREGARDGTFKVPDHFGTYGNEVARLLRKKMDAGEDVSGWTPDVRVMTYQEEHDREVAEFGRLLAETV